DRFDADDGYCCRPCISEPTGHDRCQDAASEKPQRPSRVPACQQLHDRRTSDAVSRAIEAILKLAGWIAARGIKRSLSQPEQSGIGIEPQFAALVADQRATFADWQALLMCHRSERES